MKWRKQEWEAGKDDQALGKGFAIFVISQLTWDIKNSQLLFSGVPAFQ